MIRALRLFAPLRRSRSLLATLLGWQSLRRSRRALTFLDPRLMADAGIDPREAMQETERPFWDAPAHWFDRPGH